MPRKLYLHYWIGHFSAQAPYLYPKVWPGPDVKRQGNGIWSNSIVLRKVRGRKKNTLCGVEEYNFRLFHINRIMVIMLATFPFSDRNQCAFWYDVLKWNWKILAIFFFLVLLKVPLVHTWLISAKKRVAQVSPHFQPSKNYMGHILTLQVTQSPQGGFLSKMPHSRMGIPASAHLWHWRPLSHEVGRQQMSKSGRLKEYALYASLLMPI